MSAGRYWVRLVRSVTYEMEIAAVSPTDAEEEMRGLVAAGALSSKNVDLELTISEMKGNVR